MTISESAAGATGTKGVFIVVKIDSKTEEKLPGATFTLQKMKYENGQFANEGSKAEVILKGDKEKVSRVTLTKENGWEHTFENLPKYDPATGKEIWYTLSETKQDGYSTVITGEAGSGFVVTNTYNAKVFENPKTDHPVDANKTNTAPKTGDAARIELWFCIMSSALSITFLSVRYKRKNRKI